MESTETRTSRLEESVERQMRAMERQLAAVRLVVVVFSAAVSVLLSDQVDEISLLLGIFGGVAVYNVVLVLLLRRFPAQEVGIVATALDMVAVTLAVYVASGALDTYLFYGLVILGVALRFGFGASVWSAIVMSSMYLSVVLAGTAADEPVRELLPIRISYLVGFGIAAGLFSRVVIGRANENARLQQRLADEERERAEAHERELLGQLGRDFAASLDRGEVANAILRGAGPLLGDVTWLMLVADEPETLDPVGAAGRDPVLARRASELVRERPVRLGEGMAGAAAATVTVVHGGGGREPLRPEPGDPDRVAELGLHEILAVPIASRGRVLGVLVTAMAGEGRLTAAVQRLAEQIAERAGPALENASLWVDLQDRVAREQEAQRIKDDFLSIVSHELRTPLTSIQGYSQLLEGRLLAIEPSRSKELGQLRVIRSQVARMRRLVEDLLDVSRIDRRGGVSIEPEEIDLVEEAREAVTRTAREHSDREIELQAPEALRLEADRDRIGQVLTNLLDNAVKYSPDGGAVVVRVARDGEEAVVSVSDAGIGIPLEHIDNVFERFYQASDTTGRRFGGLGLGLYITRAIVDAHGGSIRAAPNSGAGRGTVMTMRLPVRAHRRMFPPFGSEEGEPPAFVLRRNPPA